MKLQTHQVAERLQVCKRTVMRWAAKGLFSAVRNKYGHWEFDSADVARVRRRLFEGGPIRVVDPFPPGRQTSTDDGRIGVAETARRCGVSLTAVQEWANLGRLPSVRNERNERRFLASDVARLLRSERATAAPPAVEVPQQTRRMPVRRGIDLIDTDEL